MVAWRYDGVAADLRAGARARPRGRRTRGRGPGAHRARRRPRLPRPRRGGPRAASPGPAARRGDRRSTAACDRAYVNLTDVLTMLGRPRRVGASWRQAGLEAMRRYGIDSTVLVANQIEALLAIGDWDEADSASAAALRAHHRQLPVHAAHRSAPTSSSAAATSTPRGRTSRPRAPPCARTAGSASTTATSPSSPCGSAAGRTPTRPFATAWRSARPREAAQIRVWLCAKGLRAQAELAALARARRDADAAPRPGSPARGSCSPSPAAPPPRPRRSHRTPPAGSPWPRPSTSAPAAPRGPSRGRRPRRPGSELERPPLAAYCRWRQAEALVAAGASRTEASVPLREAHAVAARIGAQPLLRELELLAQRARLDLAPPDAGRPARRARAWRRSSA